MAYLVLGLGVVMAALGGLSIASGYPIIQVERGWASVIAGASLMSGGFVTIALGIVLRTLVDLKGALLAGAALPMPARGYATSFEDHAEPAFAMPAELAAAAPLAMASVPAAAAAMDFGELAAYDHHPEPMRARDEVPEPPHTEAHASETLAHVPGDLHAPEPAPTPDHTPDHLASEAGAAHPSLAVDHIADVYTTETPPAPDHGLAVSAGAPPGDWLDRAFSELDLHMPDHVAPHEVLAAPLTPAAALAPAIMMLAPTVHEPHVDPEHAVTAHHEENHELDRDAAFAEPAISEHDGSDHAIDYVTDYGVAAHASTASLEATHHEAHTAPAVDGVLERPGIADHADAHSPGHATPHPADPAQATDAETVPEPAIIGRYEADGTSYTMYADGSIAAQSSAGIYRFASMAELKAFIEG